jgi:hypothetical protein
MSAEHGGPLRRIFQHEHEATRFAVSHFGPRLRGKITPEQFAQVFDAGDDLDGVASRAHGLGLSGIIDDLLNLCPFFHDHPGFKLAIEIALKLYLKV